MTLLDEIIDLASSDKGSVATLLRKCLVLAHAINNDRLKAWAESELNGYHGADNDRVPDYRKTGATAKGLFLGPFGAQVRNQPIPPGMLRPQHRNFAESVVLFQPIASYENVGHDARFVIEWPADLTGMYQASFFEGRYALNRAWQEVPGSVFVGLIDTIKTKVLRFALELKDNLGSVSDDLNKLPKEQIDQSVITYIFGGHNVIASRDFTQIHNIDIGKGDWAALAKALGAVGVEDPVIANLQSALENDSQSGAKQSLGQRTATWLKELGGKVGKAGLAIGIEVAKTEATKWIHQYLGLPPG